METILIEFLFVLLFFISLGVYLKGKKCGDCLLKDFGTRGTIVSGILMVVIPLI